MFLNVTMLAGIAGALVPLVLHLLSRSRYRTVEWGAMMFLQGAEPRVMQSARLKQWVILLLRMGIVGLLAMALAQPVMRGRWGGLARDARVNAVIVLDCSASMQFDENGKSRMELARGTVLAILESLKESRAAVVLVGGRESDQHLATPTTDLQQLAQRVMSLPEPGGQGRMDVGLERAMEILEHGGEPARELYVVCDRQASSWKEVRTPAFAERWRARMARGGGEAGTTRFFVVPVGSEKSENLAIESVELVNPPAVRDQPCEIEVKVRNYGQAYRGNVDLKVDDRPTSVSVGADAPATVRVAMKFAQPGARLVMASLTGTGLKFDDTMKVAIDVVDPIRVLIVSGDERGAPLQNEADFLRIALAPKAAEARQKGDTSDKARGDPCRVDVVAVEQWNEEDLRKYQVVVLANVPQVTQSQGVALEQFVYEGGGLWVAPGNLTRAENYNTTLYREGAGILPVRLLPPTAEDGSEATTLQGITDFEHPMFRFLKGRPDPIPLVTIGRYFPAEVRGRDARVLAQYASGRPFLVEAPAGRGRVLVMTTALDADWGTLPLSSFYLPFAQSAVRELTAGLVAERNLSPGWPIVARFGPGIDVKSASIRLPTNEVKQLPVTRGEVRYSRTEQPGEYRLTVDGTMPDWMRGKPMYFMVRTPPVESDLTPLTAKEWSELSGALSFERVEGSREAIAGAVGAARGGHELWLTMVGVVIALSIVELAVVRRWAAGEAA
jgi:hypothetical protein